MAYIISFFFFVLSFVVGIGSAIAVLFLLSQVNEYKEKGISYSNIEKALRVAEKILLSSLIVFGLASTALSC